MWAKSQSSSHTLDLLASKFYIPNYYIIKVIHETRAEIRTQVSFSSPIASQKSPRAASWHYFTEYLDLVLISGFLTSESPTLLFRLLQILLVKYYPWDMSFLAGSHGHWEFNLKPSENLSDNSGMEEEPSGSGWISPRNTSPCFIAAGAGASGVV